MLRHHSLALRFGLPLLLVILAAGSAQAQSQPPLPDDVKAFLQKAGINTTGDIHYSTSSTTGTLVPLVYAEDLKATADAHNKITGSFTIDNQDVHFVGDIGYEILILGPEPAAIPGQLVPDSAPMYDRSKQPEVISLAPGAMKQISFTYQALAVPAGQYRVQIQLVTSNDQDMGWDDATLTLGGASAYAVLTPQTVATTSIDVVTNQQRTTWDPLEGVNVTPGQSVTLQANANNTTDQPLTATIGLTTQRLLVTDAPTTTTHGDSVTIAPHATQSISLVTPAVTAPGAYRLMLTLQTADGQRVSSLGEFRYVVRGVTASVVSATFQELRRAQGEQAVVAFTIVGPADRQTGLPGTVEVSVLNGSAVAGSATQAVQLNGAATEGTAQVTLNQNITQPGIQVVIKDQAGNILDTYKSALPDLPATAVTMPAKTQQPGVGVVLVGGLLVLLLILLGIWYRFRSSHLPPSSGAVAGGIMAIILVIGALAVGNLPTTQASGIQFHHYVFSSGWPPTTNLFINKPKHNSTIPAGSIVPYQVQMTWIACHNSYSNASLVLQTPNTPKQTNFDSEAASTTGWHTLAQHSEGGYYWAPQFILNANLDLSALAPGAKTTLRTWGNSHSTFSDGWSYGWVTDFTYLNFGAAATPTPTPSTSPTPSGSPSPTPFASGADLGVTISAPTTATKGSSISYSLNVTNNGPDAGNNVIVHEPIPTGLTFNTASSSQACQQNGSSIDCNLGTMAPNASSLLGIVFNVGSSVACNAQVTGTANVTTTSTDPNSANNSATSGQTTIVCTECEDGIDNNHDGRIDAADPACHPNDDLTKPYDPLRNPEKDPQCSDLKDNDADTFIDAKDPNCHVGNDLKKQYIPSWDNEAGGIQFSPGGFRVTE